MKKILLTLLALMLALLPVLSSAEETANALIPVYSCYPCFVDEKTVIELPNGYEAFDTGTSYKSVAIISEQMDACLVACVPETYRQKYSDVLAGEPDMSGFQEEGKLLLGGTDNTDASSLIERYTIDDLPAVRVDMIGQGYEMIWIGDEGDMYFFMYPTNNADFARDMRQAANTFHLLKTRSAARCDAADYEYTTDEAGVTITKYIGTAGRVAVPSEIDGKPVVALGDQAFYEAGVTSVTLPDSIKMISGAAFGGCNYLWDLRLPAGIEEIPGGMLESCMRLLELEIPEGVKRIGATAFWFNFYLSELRLPASLEEIEPYNFVASHYLERFDLAEGNQAFRTEDEGCVLLSADGTQFISYRPWQNRKEYTVPDGVTVIWPYSFQDFGTLKTVILPESVTTVYGMAFHGDMSLKEVRIPGTVTDLGSVPEGEGKASIVSQAKIVAPEGSPAQEHAQQFNLTFEAAPAADETQTTN